MTEERQHGTHETGKNRIKQKEEQQLQFVHSVWVAQFLFAEKNFKNNREKKIIGSLRLEKIHKTIEFNYKFNTFKSTT